MTVASAYDSRRLFRASAQAPALLEVPPLMFLAVDGVGAPGSRTFQDAIGALFSVAYTAKFALKKAGGPTYRLPPLEGLYATEDGAEVDPDAPDRMRWTLMIMQPPAVSRELVERAAEEAARKRPELPVREVRFEELAEGLSAQILHVGAYADEAPTIARLDAFVAEQGLVPRGRHHEIYLGDPRRSAPERLKTILRRPVRPRG
jgi:hypothetical protein